MTAIHQLRHQVNFDLLIFRRNPAASFFTVVLPLLFLVIFTSIFGNEELDSGAKVATVYVPGILTLAIVSATTVNLAITMTSRRERGVLKRLRGTPIPPQTFVLSQCVAGFAISALMTVLIVVIGALVYGVSLNVATLPSLVVTLLLGAGSMAALGLAMTAVIPSEEAAPAVTNAIMLPLYFVSGVFVPESQVPDWVVDVSRVFPIYHLNKALQGSFDPFLEGTTWPLSHWLVLLVWGSFGAVIALRFFRWVPRR
ncbi:MAG: ABC transporter permease [Acidimicrobiia bacterium]|nr:ABC transporter permease [Acidimicrobiia bacterium]